MALYFYFNELNGNLVYSDQATYDAENYTSLGEQTNMNPNSQSAWIFDSQRSVIETVSKDSSTVGKIVGLTNMNSMFHSCNQLRRLDLSGFDTSAVTDMSHMLHGCKNLIERLDFSSFDTSAVTDMCYMFYGCINISKLDLSSFDTSAVTDMGSMFYNCSSLSSLDLSSFDTSAVTDMRNMFYRCTDLTSLDLSSFDTSAVTDMSNMFQSCSSLTSLDLSGFDTSAVTDTSNMFRSCSSLTSLDLSGFDTSAVTDMSNMFFESNALCIVDISLYMSNLRLELPAAIYYDAATRQPYAKGDIPGGSTYVRDLADLDLVSTMIQNRQAVRSVRHVVNGLSKRIVALESSVSSLVQ